MGHGVKLPAFTAKHWITAGPVFVALGEGAVKDLEGIEIMLDTFSTRSQGFSAKFVIDLLGIRDLQLDGIECPYPLGSFRPSWKNSESGRSDL